MSADFDAAGVLAAFDGDVSDIRQLISLMSASLPVYVRDLSAAAQAGDRRGVAAMAHTIRGSVGNIKAGRLAALARDLEVTARTGAPLQDVHLNAVKGASSSLVAALAAWSATLGAPEA